MSSTVRDNNGNVVPAIGGTITLTSRQGLATRIEWDNGVILLRGGAEPFPSTGRSLFELGGTWQSNVGAQYFFSQVGRSFSWRAPTLSQYGEGTIEGPSATSGFTSVIIFEDSSGGEVIPNWYVISAQDAAGVIEMYGSA